MAFSGYPSTKEGDVMFADPLVLDWIPATALTDALTDGAGAVTVAFACTGRGPNSSTYRYDYDGAHFIEVFVGHLFGKRNRYTVRLTETELVPDPVDPSINSKKVTSAFIVVDQSLLGANAGRVFILHALAGFLWKTTGGTQVFNRVLAGET
jgi:hypothetical protein